MDRRVDIIGFALAVYQLKYCVMLNVCVFFASNSNYLVLANSN